MCVGSDFETTFVVTSFSSSAIRTLFAEFGCCAFLLPSFTLESLVLDRVLWPVDSSLEALRCVVKIMSFTSTNKLLQCLLSMAELTGVAEQMESSANE